ncbi:hypothetical protein [Streptomyces niger]|uniref:hypothetical protein n=1 Tax=Streptomyces niger TaxID=66373 RepID=UPI0018FE58CE|nr:hypothetical protein [Streptomyces niger]
MKTVSYVVYDGDTGTVLHIHAEPVELESTPEEILLHADPRRQRQNLKVLKVPADAPAAAPMRVVDDRIVYGADGREAETEAAVGGAGVIDGTPEETVERAYETR